MRNGAGGSRGWKMLASRKILISLLLACLAFWAWFCDLPGLPFAIPAAVLSVWGLCDLERRGSSHSGYFLPVGILLSVGGGSLFFHLVVPFMHKMVANDMAHNN